MTKDVKKFDETLTSYVYLKECAAIAQEREEAGYDIEVYDLENYLDDLKNSIPEVDFYLPIRDYNTIDELFKKLIDRKQATSFPSIYFTTLFLFLQEAFQKVTICSQF